MVHTLKILRCITLALEFVAFLPGAFSIDTLILTCIIPVPLSSNIIYLYIYISVMYLVHISHYLLHIVGNKNSAFLHSQGSLTWSQKYQYISYKTLQHTDVGCFYLLGSLLHFEHQTFLHQARCPLCLTHLQYIIGYYLRYCGTSLMVQSVLRASLVD